jgi:nucleoside-diphosphate-sugar epimerase
MTLVSELYAAATRAGVGRFVQFSSAVVYGSASGDVTEATALSPNGDYARGKAEMEKRLLEAAVPSAPQLFILRPSIVYGPFADFWTVRYVERVSKGRWRSLGAAGSGTCNLVHAHDVARVVVAAATAAVEPGAHVLNVNGPETLTWNDYVEQLGNALGTTDRVTPSFAWFRTVAATAEILRKASQWSPLRSFYRRSKGATRAVFTGAQGVTKLYPASGELRLLRQKVNYKSGRVTTVLGVSPSISLTDGLRQSVEWCRVHGIC